MKEVFEYYFLELLLPAIEKKVKSDRADIFKTKSDLSKVLYVESDQKIPGLSVRLTSGNEVNVSDVKFIVHGTRLVSDLDQAHVKFNDMMVSTSKHLDTDGSLLKFNIVQDQESKQILGRWSRGSNEVDD